MKKKIIIMILAILIIIPTFVTAAAQRSTYHVLTAWSVDDGKHMDWSGSITYISNWNTAVNLWNSYKSGVIRKDTLFTVNDVTISEGNTIPNNMLAITTQYGPGHSDESTVLFSKTEMSQLTNLQRSILCAHEIGHLLGLGDNYDNGTAVIMYPYPDESTSNNVLHAQDKLNYNYMYNNKY
jgi:hypothetical protein